MAVIGWSVRGRRVEYRTATFDPAKILLDGEESSNPLLIDGEQFVVRMKRGTSDTPVELVTTADEEIPPTPALVVPQRAPEGAACGQHPESPAAIACPRCGGFFCSAPGCTFVDGTHCVRCAPLLLAAQPKPFSSLWYFVPIFPLVMLGSFVGGCTGLIAGLISLAVARRTENRTTRLVVTIALYVLATIPAAWFGLSIMWRAL